MLTRVLMTSLGLLVRNAKKKEMVVSLGKKRKIDIKLPGPASTGSDSQLANSDRYHTSLQLQVVATVELAHSRLPVNQHYHHLQDWQRCFG
jgi:hypothetical protein